LLAQSVAAQYAGRVNFVTENFGASKLADRYGVKGYPAVFVDGVLVAHPREFGYFGGANETGRYAPWRNAENQAKFRADLTRMIDLMLAGRKDVVSREHPAEANPAQQIGALPEFRLTDFAGQEIATEQLRGKVVLVEFWATWCPPCRSTLQWLGAVRKKYGERVAVVALALESPEQEARTLAEQTGGGLRWAMATPEAGRAFGDITSVPTLFVFDREGKTARVLYGAPPDLHEQVGKTIESLVR
jgi:thiol-disulfide isomerase/thioredoxin